MKKLITTFVLLLTGILLSTISLQASVWVGFKTSNPDASNYQANLYHEMKDNKVFIKMSVPMFDWVSEEGHGNYKTIVHTDNNYYFNMPDVGNDPYFNYDIGIPSMEYTSFIIDSKSPTGTITRKHEIQTTAFDYIHFENYGEGFYVMLKKVGQTQNVAIYRFTNNSSTSLYFYKNSVNVTSRSYFSNTINNSTNLTMNYNDPIVFPGYDTSTYSYSKTAINGYLTNNTENTTIRAVSDMEIDRFYKPSNTVIAYFIGSDDKVLKVHYVNIGGTPVAPTSIPNPPSGYVLDPNVWDKVINRIYVDTVYKVNYIFDGNIIEGWNDLPKTIGTVADIDKSDFNSRVGHVTFTKLSNGNYNTNILYQGVNYLAQDISFSFLGEDPAKAYYYTHEDNKYIWFILTSALKPTSYHIAANAWVIYNVNTGEWIRTSDVSIFGMPHVKSNYNIYVDLVIPYGVDDLVSVIMSYKYQYQWPIGTSSPREVKNKTFTKGDEVIQTLPWWGSGFGLYNSIIKNNEPNLFLEDVIVPKTNLTDTYKSTFVNYINQNKPDSDLKLYKTTDIFIGGYNVYEIFMGSYSEFPAVNVRAKEVVIVNIRYIENGVEFSKPYPKIVIPDMPKFEGGIEFDTAIDNPFDFLKLINFKNIDFNSWITWVAIIIIASVLLVVLSYVIKAVSLVTSATKTVFTPMGIVITLTIILIVLILIGVNGL